MTINSKQKGKRNELLLAKYLREHGYENARRSVQYCGASGDSADIVDAIPGLHLECKAQEKTQIWAWYEQAERDAKDGEIPTVVFRQNRKPWMVCVSLEDFLRILKGESPL